MKNLKDYKKEAFRKYKVNDYVNDIESIIIAYDKKGFRKIGLTNLVKEIRKQEKERITQIVKSTNVFCVVNGQCSKQRIADFTEGEEAGQKALRDHILKSIKRSK